MQCIKATTGCPVMPLTATCIPVAVHDAVPRAQPAGTQARTSPVPGPAGIGEHELAGDVTPGAVISRVGSRATGRTHPPYAPGSQKCSEYCTTAYSVTWQDPAGGGYRNAADTAIMPG